MAAGAQTTAIPAKPFQLGAIQNETDILFVKFVGTISLLLTATPAIDARADWRH
jgi:hypothetical protein